jgi:lipopolysaccharide export LptBFGC system permease protein LptF
VKFWRDHSLTVVLGILGTIGILVAFTFESHESRQFDLWLGLGCGVLTVALFYFLSQFLGKRRSRKIDCC